MRHAHKNAATNEEPKPSLVPKLRFPEFEGAGAWASRTFGDVTTKTDKRNKGGISYPVYSISNKAGFVPQSEQFAGVDSEKRGYDLAQYKLVGRNTFAYNPARINVGSIGFSGDLENVIVSSLYVCFKSNLEADDQFLQHFFSTRMFERSVCNHAEGGIRSYLFYENFSRIEILLPTLPEQQRIASCLSSLDELITTQTRKVDALKTHKKGLMQQLFPREGETQPRLRFPEFEGEWEEIELGAMVDLLSGYPFDGPDISQDSSGVPLLRGINVTEGRIRHSTEIDRFYCGPTEGLERFRLQANDLVIGMDGSKVGKNSALVSEADAGALLIQRVARLRARQESAIQFIFQRINSPYFHAYVDRINTSSGIPHVSSKQIKEFRICVPSEAEQQRIASCLSSLDDLITNESHKLETYKTHKKGLMQGLFPKVEEGS
jgi:type I restriction enzyme, S subunit